MVPSRFWLEASFIIKRFGIHSRFLTKVHECCSSNAKELSILEPTCRNLLDQKSSLPTFSCFIDLDSRYHSRCFDCIAHPNLSATLATDQKWPLKLSSYLLPKFSRVPFTIVLIPLISTIVNGTLLNFGKRYKDNFKGHFWSVVKVALRFGCAKQSKNLEWYLLLSLLMNSRRDSLHFYAVSRPILE